MPSWIGPWEIMLCIGCLVAAIFYLITLQQALARCSPQNRKMAPGLVWLEIIPVIGFVWQFFVAIALGKSLENEFRAREIRAPSRPGQSVGIATAAVLCASAVFYIVARIAEATGLGQGSAVFDGNPVGVPTGWIGSALGWAGLVLWIIYWVNIHGFSSRLEVRPVLWMAPYGPMPYQPPYGPSPYYGPAPAPFPRPYPPPAMPPQAPMQAPPQGPNPCYGDFCASCGQFAPAARFCPRCGQARQPVQTRPSQ